MSYKNQLNPWCIMCLLPDQQSRFLARFRRRSEAEGRMQVLRTNNPMASYKVVFDTTAERLESPTNQELSSAEVKTE